MRIDHRIARYLDGPAWTLWTFIKYTERSGDPAHAWRVRRAMRAELERLVRLGAVRRVRSIKGRLAYRRRPPQQARSACTTTSEGVNHDQ